MTDKSTKYDAAVTAAGASLQVFAATAAGHLASEFEAGVRRIAAAGRIDPRAALASISASVVSGTAKALVNAERHVGLHPRSDGPTQRKKQTLLVPLTGMPRDARAAARTLHSAPRQDAIPAQTATALIAQHERALSALATHHALSHPADAPDQPEAMSIPNHTTTTRMPHGPAALPDDREHWTDASAAVGHRERAQLVTAAARRTASAHLGPTPDAAGDYYVDEAEIAEIRNALRQHQRSLLSATAAPFSAATHIPRDHRSTALITAATRGAAPVYRIPPEDDVD